MLNQNALLIDYSRLTPFIVMAVDNMAEIISKFGDFESIVFDC
jgi:hypothetical protein